MTERTISVGHQLGVFAVEMAVLLGACRTTQDASEVFADADVYIEAYCAEFADRTEECADEGYMRQDVWTFDECVTDRTQDVDADPCFVEETELFRCFAERLTCQEWTADSISTLPGTPCDEFASDSLMCLGENDDANAPD